MDRVFRFSFQDAVLNPTKPWLIGGRRLFATLSDAHRDMHASLSSSQLQVESHRSISKSAIHVQALDVTSALHSDLSRETCLRSEVGRIRTSEKDESRSALDRLATTTDRSCVTSQPVHCNHISSQLRDVKQVESRLTACSVFFKGLFRHRRSHKRSPNYLYQLCLSGGRGDSLGPGQTQLPSLNGKEILEGWAHLTRTPFSLAICFDRARKKATRAPLVEP